MQQLLSLGFAAVQGPQRPFRPPRNGSRDVQGGARAVSPSEDEGVHRLEGGREVVDLLLEPLDVPGLDAVLGWGGPRGGRELALGDEQLVLQALEQDSDLRVAGRERGEDEPQVGPELVEGAERGDPRGILRYALATNETGLAAVTGTGV